MEIYPLCLLLGIEVLWQESKIGVIRIKDAVLKDDQVRSRRCMRNCMSVKKAREVCLEWKEWKSVLSAHTQLETLHDGY